MLVNSLDKALAGNKYDSTKKKVHIAVIAKKKRDTPEKTISWQNKEIDRYVKGQIQIPEQIHQH